MLNVVGGHHPRLEVIHGEGGGSSLLLGVASLLGGGDAGLEGVVWALLPAA